MRTKTERVIAEADGQGWLVMWPNGEVRSYVSKQAVLMACKKRIGGADILLTEIEWRR